MAKNVKNPSGYHSAGKTLQEKAANFGSFVKQHGWTGSFKTAENGDVNLLAQRGDSESIEICWLKGGGGSVRYTLAGTTVKCHNVSAAAKIAQEPPDINKVQKAVRKRHVAPENGEITPDILDGLQGSLPFDRESTDQEIKLALKDRNIAWINRLSGTVYQAVVGVSKQFKVIRAEDPVRDQISFVEVTPRGILPQFRAVYLNSIVSVG
jgi:hypothetical protein